MPITESKSLLYRLFQLSGLCGIMYQVLWSRQFTYLLGSSTQSVSIVITAFMFGAALGARYFGHRADASRNPLHLYAVLELCAVGLSGLFFLLFAHLEDGWQLIGGHIPYVLLKWLSCAIGFVFVALPIALSASGLPLLSRCLVARNDELKSRVGRLYAMNTLGAAWGALLAGYVSIRCIGYAGTLWVALALHLAVGLGALFYSGRITRPAPELPASPTNASSTPYLNRSIVPFVFALSGFTALGYELLWFRCADHLLFGTLPGFGLVLGIYLFGLSLGSSLFSRNNRRPDREAFWFAGCQFAIALLVLASPPLFAVSARYESLFVMFVILTLLFLLTILLGGIFPLAARLYTGSLTVVGRSVGTIYTANTLGAMFGALLCAFVLIPVLGNRFTLLLLTSLNLIIGFAVSFRQRRARPLQVTAAALFLAMSGLLLTRPWFIEFKRQRAVIIHNLSDLRVLAHVESHAQSLIVYEETNGHRTLCAGPFISGSSHTERRFTQRLQAHVPMLIHPHPRQVLEIGYGVGEISRTLLQHDLRHLDLVEIDELMVPFAERHFSQLNHCATADPRVQVHIMDGRHFLKTTRRKYDLILSDSMMLTSTGSLRLYTYEHFREGQRHLHPNGIMTVWLPLYTGGTRSRIIIKTFQAVFPETWLWLNPKNAEAFLIGFNHPRAFRADYLAQRFSHIWPDLHIWGWQDPDMLLSGLKAGPADLAAVTAEVTSYNHDFNPILDFVKYDDHYELLDELLALSPPRTLAFVERNHFEEKQQRELAHRLESIAIADRDFARVFRDFRSRKAERKGPPDPAVSATTEKRLRQILTSCPEHVYSRYLLASLLVHDAMRVEGKPEAAKSLFQKALEMNAWLPDANAALARMALKRQDLQTARQLVSRGLAYGPYFKELISLSEQMKE